MRSCVSGRAVSTPSSASAIAVASGVPIQIGRYRRPSRSRNSRMGVFVGSSMRTPTTSMGTRSLMGSAYHRDGCQTPGGTAWRKAWRRKESGSAVSTARSMTAQIEGTLRYWPRQSMP